MRLGRNISNRLVSRTNPGAERAIQTLERSLGFGLLDSHLNQGFLWLGRVARYQGKWGKQIDYLEKARSHFDHLGDIYGVISVYVEMKRTHARRGRWKDFIATHERGVVALSRMPTTPSVLKADLWGQWAWTWALAGRFAEGEQNAREALKIAHELQLEFFGISLWRDLAWTLGVQGKFKEAYECLDESLMIIHKGFGRDKTYDEGATLAFLGAILSKDGHPEPAKHNLIRSREIADSLHAIPGTIESLTWLGLASEVQHDWEDASRHYRSRTEWKWYGSNYFQCSALTGLARVKHAQGDYDAVPPLLVDAEQLAQQYEYNDHLASLRLTQGHIAWDRHIPEWDSGFDAALRYYQHALIHALRYNRFMLDEALSGRPRGTPLRPIIPHCLEQGEEGRRMLIALRDWWRTGVNDIGTPRPDTISPIPEGIPLLEADRIAHEREPGDGSPQRTVIAQIDEALPSSAHPN